jgi:uncharacterized protein
MSKKTLVIGASTNPSRYSYKAVVDLIKNGHEVIAYGRNSGIIESVPIVTEIPKEESIDTITVYISKDNQKDLLDIIKQVKPLRVIFNPGTENYDIVPAITALGIESIEACTLVMLSIGDY